MHIYMYAWANKERKKTYFNMKHKWKKEYNNTWQKHDNTDWTIEIWKKIQQQHYILLLFALFQ